MNLKNDSLRYGVVAQLFHWGIVALIVLQFALANKAEAFPLGAAKLATLAQHKSIGITILALALLRLLWRLLGPTPALPETSSRWRNFAAYATHFVLYALLIAIPILGWLMSSARNFPVSWFGLITLPDFVEPGETAFDFFHQAHEIAAKTLFVLALLHVAAALKHHFIDRDNVLRRMLPMKLRNEVSR